MNELKKKVLAGLRACHEEADTLEQCKRLGCPYADSHFFCVRVLMEDALRALSQGTELAPREELLQGYGHGWEERWYVGDEEEPDPSTSLRMTDLYECVWLDGQMIVKDGGGADADSEWWTAHYGKQYGVRVWRGDDPPTDEQREETPWA